MKELLDQRWPWLVAAGLLLLVLISTFVQIRLPGDWDRRPLGTPSEIAALRNRGDLNVLYIVVDTLRAERLGSYGYQRDTSPFLDQLASTGVRFERHLAQSSWTKSSMASMWTGLYPGRSGITRYDDVIPDEAQMPAEVLREAGFQTIGLWRNGWVSPTFGFAQGFDVYQRPIAPPPPPNIRIENPTLTERGTDESLVAVAEEFLRVDGKERWFLYVHLMDLHEYIYDAESALFGTGHSDNYDNSLRWTDETIRLLVETLSELGLLDKTLIAVVSDHGEAFGERGFEGHARGVYRETTEVPFLLSLPFRLEPGVVVRGRSQNVDIWPTIFDLLGLDSPGEIDGNSRLPDIVASAEGRQMRDGGRTAVVDLDRNWARRDSDPLQILSVVQDSLRYVRQVAEEGPVTEQLFDATGDPYERRNRSVEQPEQLAQMRALADAYLEAEPSWGDVPKREISELELNLLRALGYKIE